MTDEKSELVSKWSYEIDQYERRMEKWSKRCKKIIDRYSDERKGVNDNRQPRFNSLWANIQTMMPALYARVPKPEIERRYRSSDDVGRVACEALQRCSTFSLSVGDAHTKFRQSVFDYLTTARGTLWVRYTAQYRDIAPAKDTEITDDEPDQEVSWEEVVCDYVHWKDFGHTDGRTWEEVSGVWRKAYMNRNALVKRFGKEIGNEVPLNWQTKDGNSESVDTGKASTKDKKAVIYEIWDKDSKKAVWICKDYQKELDVRDDPLKLKNFFPCPKPLYATVTNDKLEPVPDYVLYQDQAMQLDELTQRIASMVKAVKVAGVFDASAQGVQRLLNEGVENTLIPVEAWALFAEKGGMQGAIQWMPLGDIVQALEKLYEAREAVKKDMYEITGLSDLLRGNTDPDETATAQGLKSGYVSMRFQDRRDEIQRFLRDTIQIMCEVIAEQFGLETIKTMSGLDLFDSPEEKQAMQQQIAMQSQPPQQDPSQQPAPPQPPPEVPEEMQEKLQQPTWAEVMQLLKSDQMRTVRIDIETDSTIRADDNQEKADRTEMLTAVSAFMEKAVAAPPEMAPLMSQLLLFTVRSFRVGRQLEADFETAIEKLRKNAANPPTPPPDPEMAKVQGQLSIQQSKDQGAQQLAQMQAQLADQQHQRELAADQQAAQASAQIAAQLEEHKQTVQMQQNQHQNELEAARAQQQAHMDAQLEAQRVASDERMAAMDRQLQVLLAHLANAGKIEVAEMANQTTLAAAQISAAKTSQAD